MGLLFPVPHPPWVLKRKSTDQKEEPEETLPVSDKERKLVQTDGSAQKTVASERRRLAWICTRRDLEGRAVMFKGRGLWPRAWLGRASRRGI